MAEVQVLVVEDELIVAEDICNKLERLGYQVQAVVGYGMEAVQAAVELRPDLVLMDIGLPGEMDGVEAAEQISARLDIPVVYLTAHSDENTLARARVTAPFGYVLKPFDARELRSTLEMALYRHEQEQRVRESEARYRDLYENAPNAHFSVGTDGRIRQCNRRASELLGYAQDELLGRLVFDLYADTPQGKEKARAIFESFLAGEEVRDEELQMQRADGSLLWVSLTRTPIRDARGQLVESRSVVVDITDRKQAQEELAQRIAQLALLNDVSGQIAATLHLDSVLHQAARLVQKRFGYHHVALFTLDQQRRELVMRARAGDFADLFPPQHRLALGQGVVGWVGESGEMLLANDVDAEPRYVNLYPNRIPTRSELSMPIRVAGKLIGVLDVQSPQVDAFDKDDVTVMETLADQIAVAINNARLYEAARQELAERKRAEAALQRALRGLEQHQVELSALLAGANAILKYQDFGQSARVIFDICKHLLGARAGYVALRIDGKMENKVLFLDPGGLPCEADPELPMPIRGLRAEAYRTGQAVYDNDFAASEWADLLSQGHAVLNNALFAPLMLDGQPMGLLGLANKSGDFTQADARMAEAFADLAAIALNNSRTLGSLEQSERRFRSVVQTASDAIITADSRGQIVSWNQGAEKMFGYSAGEMSEVPFARIMPEELREQHRVGLEQYLSSGESPPMGRAIETTGLRKDGSTFPLELSLTNWTAGELDFFTAIVRDVTERVQLQREGERRRQYLENVLASAPDAIVTLDNQHCVLDWNQGAQTLFGYSPEEVIGRNFDDLITGDNASTMKQATGLTQQVLGGERVLPHETIRYRQDGTPVNVIAAGSPIYVGEEMVGIVAVYADITERKQAEQALQELNLTLEDRVEQRTFELQVLHELSQEIGYTLSYDDLFRLILQHLHRVCEYDIAGSLLVSGDQWQAFVRQTRPTDEGMLAEVQEQLLQTYERLADRARPETEIVPKVHLAEQYDPSLPAVRSLNSCVQVPIFAAGSVLGIVYVGSEGEKEFGGDVMRVLYTLASQAADSIQRLRALLAKEQQRLERLVENLPDGILLLDDANRILLTNPIAEEILSMLDGAGAGDTLTHLGDYAIDRVLLEGSGPVPLLVSAAGPASRLFEVSAHPYSSGPSKEQRTVVALRDVTEARRLEKQMQQQDRLVAVGQLAGGIAHDFNNILTTIILYSQTILRQRDELPPRAIQGLETILDSGRRAADLVRQILDFSRHAPMKAHRVDLRTFVEGVMNVLERTLPENIFIKLDKGTSGCVIQADPTRIQQVLMNLAVNARDAMPEGGDLHVKLSRLFLKPEQEPPVVEMPAGDWVCLTVADTGTGMPPEVVAHIFEPFFTTKPRGQGTGLGLAQVYGIVKQHGGFIGVETKPGQGTAFRVYLPSDDGERASGSLPDLDISLETFQGQAETILLVEDEDMLRTMGRELLEALGYRVLTAADGQEALQIYRSVGGIDLLITDMIMPKMGGKALVQALQKEAPHLKALAVSGYSLAEDLRELRAAGILGIVAKPYDEAALAKAVRDALDRS